MTVKILTKKPRDEDMTSKETRGVACHLL